MTTAQTCNINRPTIEQFQKKYPCNTMLCGLHYTLYKVFWKSTGIRLLKHSRIAYNTIIQQMAWHAGHISRRMQLQSDEKKYIQ